jgi:hypothetical protein
MPSRAKAPVSVYYGGTSPSFDSQLVDRRYPRTIPTETAEATLVLHHARPYALASMQSRAAASKRAAPAKCSLLSSNTSIRIRTPFAFTNILYQ